MVSATRLLLSLNILQEIHKLSLPLLVLIRFHLLLEHPLPSPAKNSMNTMSASVVALTLSAIDNACGTSGIMRSPRSQYSVLYCLTMGFSGKGEKSSTVRAWVRLSASEAAFIIMILFVLVLWEEEEYMFL